MSNVEFKVTFWGVRGSRPVPGPNTVKYGGNTSCIQVQIGDQLIIFDAGTGICGLGEQLAWNSEPVNGSIFLTHTHWDHIQGFPFFVPAFMPGNRFSIFGPHKTDQSLRNLLCLQMDYPYFPVSLDTMEAELNFIEIADGETVSLGNDITVKAIGVYHPNGCLAYRIECRGRSCCYLTDIEHSNEADEKLQSFIVGSDLLIYDTTFTEEEYLGIDPFAPKTHWGHSTWQQGVSLAQAAKVKNLALFHHGAFRADKALDDIEEMAKQLFPNCFAAREGTTFKL